MTSNVTGIDVSKYQGKIDWAKAVNAGVVFAAARAVVGWGYTDSWFPQNREEMIKNGVLWTAYAVFWPTLDIQKQVDHFFDTMGNNPTDLPLALDLEYGSWYNDPPLKKSTLIDNVYEWLIRVEKRDGRRPLLYTNINFWNNEMLYRGRPPSWASKYDLWVANYGVKTPNLPKGWDDWKFWQYSADNNEQGPNFGTESRAVDLDQFNGDELALKKYLGLVKGDETEPAPVAGPVESITIEIRVPKGTEIVFRKG